MTNKQIYEIWAPDGKTWVDWVRPVPFIDIDYNKRVHEFVDYTIPNINYLKDVSDDTAIIVDVQGSNSIKEGIALAKLGYRPIPIFNGTNPPIESISTTNNSIIGSLLVWGAFELNKINIKDDALPVFLLDENRLNRYKVNRSIFDNSWDIYPQDIPSADYMIEKGITKIIVRANIFNNDLKKVLYKYQKNNIKILFTNGYEEPIEVKIKKIKTKN